jgi:phage protein U
MATIGRFGNIIKFEIKKPYEKIGSRRILVFSDFSQKESGRWAEYPIIGGKTKSSFGGVESEEIKLTVLLNAENGVAPRHMIAKLKDAVEKGTLDYLIINGKKVGKSKFKLTDIDADWLTIMKKGELSRAEVKLTFKEYV